MPDPFIRSPQISVFLPSVTRFSRASAHSIVLPMSSVRTKTHSSVNRTPLIWFIKVIYKIQPPLKKLAENLCLWIF